jgi:CubicO group peptidase (beta-lactamase class C family)
MSNTPPKIAALRTGTETLLTAALLCGLLACGEAENSEAPWALGDSTPEAQGLNPEALAAAYERAGAIPHIYSMLVLKNGYLVAEQYFNGQHRDTAHPVASVTKSIVSALVGLALEDGYLTDLDQRMLDFFPEYDTPGLDPRKRDITIRQLLQMRAGYPTDNIPAFYSSLFGSGNWIRFIVVDHPLETTPGTRWHYSSASAHLLSAIVTRASRLPLYDFARERLYEPLGLLIRSWPEDPQGFYVGYGDNQCTPRQLASFGQMYLDGGSWNGRQVLPTTWIDESFRDYSQTEYGTLGPYRDIRYGYLWWHAEVDDHDVYFAWGHGGNFIMLAPDLRMLVVTTAHNFAGDFTQNSWDTEGAIFFLIAEHVLPTAY